MVGGRKAYKLTNGSSGSSLGCGTSSMSLCLPRPYLMVLVVEARDVHEDCVCSLECPDFFPSDDALSDRASEIVLSEACDFKGDGRVGGGLLGEIRVLDIDPDRLCAVPFFELGVGGSGLFGGDDVVVRGLISDGLVIEGVLEGSLVVRSFLERGGGGNAMLRPSISRLSIS